MPKPPTFCPGDAVTFGPRRKPGVVESVTRGRGKVFVRIAVGNGVHVVRLARQVRMVRKAVG